MALIFAVKCLNTLHMHAEQLSSLKLISCFNICPKANKDKSHQEWMNAEQGELQCRQETETSGEEQRKQRSALQI